MTVLWDIFEISINFFQGFIMMYFPYKFSGGKSKGGFVKNHGVVFTALLAVLISVLNYVTVFEYFFIFLYIALIGIFSFTCLKGRYIDRIYASVFPVLIVVAVSAMTSTLYSALFGKPVYEIIVQKNIQRVISVVLTQLIILYMILLSLRIFTRNKKTTYHISANEWMLISVTLLLSMAAGLFLVRIALGEISQSGRLYIFLVLVSVVMINIVMFYFVISLGKKNAVKTENEKLKMQIEYNEQFIKNADTEYSLIQKLRHDNKAMFQMLNDFLSNGEIDEAKDYLKKMAYIADNRIIFVNTENAFANSIINARLTTAKSFGINAVCMTVNSFTGIDDIDLSRLLSNMLDNAITATSESEMSDKKITVNISEDLGVYTFIVCNSIKESVLQKNPQLLSTRKSREVSGLGTKIIRDISEKYNGRCDFYEKEDMFCCSVMLNTDY